MNPNEQNFLQNRFMMPSVPQPAQNSNLPMFMSYFYLPQTLQPQYAGLNWPNPEVSNLQAPQIMQPKPSNPPSKDLSTNKKEFAESQPSRQKDKTLTCRCSKSHCRKEYCFCYKNGVSCNEKCTCVSCKNTEDALNIKHDFKKITSQTCNCVKSKCQKKYCECFAAGKKCGELCNCRECKNC